MQNTNANLSPSDSGSRSSSGDTGEGELVEVAVLRYTSLYHVWPKKAGVSDSSYTPAILHSVLVCVFCMYSGTPPNGHPSTADTSDITDKVSGPDCVSVDFRTFGTQSRFSA